MAYDEKYGKITAEKKDLPDDEPVFLIRGQDAAAPSAISGYAAEAKAEGASDKHVERALARAREIRQWQDEHPARVKVPD